MRFFARIDNGVVADIFPPADIPAELAEIIPEDGDIRPMFHPSMVWEEVTGLDLKPSVGWTYAEGSFAAPVPYVPTPAEILENNRLDRDHLLEMATRAIAPLQDAVDLDEATETETSLLKKWKQYRVAVNRIDLVVAEPSWPAAPA